MSRDTVAVESGLDEAALDTSRGEELLSVANLRKYYDVDTFGTAPVRALDGVSLSVDRGETVAVVGESGSGKTTLGRSIARLDRPTSGTIVFDGDDVTDVGGRTLERYRRHCQLVFQDPDSSLNSRQTVGEIVSEPLKVHGWGTTAERRERTMELLDAVGLAPEHYVRYPHQFSGGQRQRIAIARALTLEPELLVLDEPVSALDVSVQAQILRLLSELQAEFNLTYLLITHDLGVVRTIADRVVVMYLGQIMERGPTETVFDSPANPYTRALLSAVPEPDPTVPLDPEGMRGSPPDPRSPPDGCPFATRCPVKIRENSIDVSQSTQVALDAFREILRERATSDTSVWTKVSRFLGRNRDEHIDSVRSEQFGDVDLDGAFESAIEEIVQTYRADGPTAALSQFDDSFGSVCDKRPPDLDDIGDGETASRCHRHSDQYPAVDELD